MSEFFKPPTHLNYLKDWGGGLSVLGLILSVVVYFLFGIEKAILVILACAIFVISIFLYRGLSAATKLWEEIEERVDEAAAKLPATDKKKDIAIKFKNTNYRIKILIVILLSVVAGLGIYTTRHWVIDKFYHRRPSTLDYSYCDIINPADRQDLFTKWPFLEPLKVRILEEASGGATGVLYATTQPLSHAAPAFDATMKVAQASCEVVIYAFLKSSEEKILPLQVDYPGDGLVVIHVPPSHEGDSLVYFGRITGKKLPTKIQEELKLNVN